MAIINGLADLHTHTTASDGLHSPAEVVKLAAAAGLAAVAITDHDTVAGVAEAASEGERLGITVVPGVEVSTVADNSDIHILGYYMESDNQVWLERLAGLRSVREQRNQLMVERLCSLGISISMEEVLAAAGNRHTAREPGKKEGSIGRPHIAKVLIEKGIVSTIQEAFDRYLAAGAAAYVNPPRVHPRDAINWIHEAGGISVIAHPGLYGNDRLVEQLVQGGARGIEVYHSDHGVEEEVRYSKLAHQYGLIMTGGSDFHGVRNNESYHGAIGSRAVALSVLQQLRTNKRG